MRRPSRLTTTDRVSVLRYLVLTQRTRRRYRRRTTGDQS